MHNYYVVTLFPELIEPYLAHLPFKRALEKNLIQVRLVNLRDFAIDKRGTVDSPPYGSGPGMILRPEPLYNAVQSVAKGLTNNPRIIFLTPRGKTFNQQIAQEIAKAENMILICGRYEGFDQRVVEELQAEELSIGKYVLSGGEAAATVVLECSIRLIPGAIDNAKALVNESFNTANVEHPQYARPQTWRGRSVPKILTEGHHKKIASWKLSATAWVE